MSQTEREGASPSPFCKKLQPALDYYDILSLRGRLKKSSSRCFVRKKGHLRDGKGVTAPPPRRGEICLHSSLSPFCFFFFFAHRYFFLSSCFSSSLPLKKTHLTAPQAATTEASSESAPKLSSRSSPIPGE